MRQTTPMQITGCMEPLVDRGGKEMTLRFFTRLSKNERLLALEQVVSDDMRLYTVVGNAIVIPVKKFKETQQKAHAEDSILRVDEVNPQIVGFSGELTKYNISDDYWSDPCATELLNHINAGTRTFKLADLKSVAITILSGINESLGAANVLNEDGEPCFVFDYSSGSKKIDGTSALGFSRVYLKENNFAVAPVTFAEKADRYPINTPEFAAVIDV